MKKVIIVEEKQNTLNYILNWLIQIVAYSIVLISLSLIFRKTLIIDNGMYGLWAILATILIFILNKTIKPILVWLTLPITAITLGLFYPFINVFILNIVDFILGPHFTINGIFMSFIVAILISMINGVMDNLIINPIIRRNK